MRTDLVHELMDARRAVGGAKRADDPVAERRARDRVRCAKVALGERGPTWWEGLDAAGRRVRVEACLIALLRARRARGADGEGEDEGASVTATELAAAARADTDDDPDGGGDVDGVVRDVTARLEREGRVTLATDVGSGARRWRRGRAFVD